MIALYLDVTTTASMVMYLQHWDYNSSIEKGETK